MGFAISHSANAFSISSSLAYSSAWSRCCLTTDSSNSSSRENISQTQLNEGKASITQEKESGDVDPKIQAYLDAMLKMR